MIGASVRPTVCPSVTLWLHSGIVKNDQRYNTERSSEDSILARLGSLRNSIGFTTLNETGVGTYWRFRHLNGCISETVQDRTKFAIDH